MVLLTVKGGMFVGAEVFFWLEACSCQCWKCFRLSVFHMVEDEDVAEEKDLGS